MLYGENVDIYSEKNAKHINTVWQNNKLLIAEPVGASRKQ
jgi:hypothetical protein